MTNTYFHANECDKTEVLAAIDKAGYVILLDAISRHDLTVLREELEPHFKERPNSQAYFFGFNTKRIESLFTKSTVTQQMATHPLVLDVANHISGPELR